MIRWPITIAPPTEGSMDRETWNHLIGLLRAHSPAGADTRMPGGDLGRPEYFALALSVSAGNT